MSEFLSSDRKKTRVGLIFGGKSGEHEVSLASAYSVAQAIDREKYDLVLIGITKGGGWLVGEGVLRQLAAASPSPLLLPDPRMNQANNGKETMSGNGILPLASVALATTSPLASIDVAFPLLHGPFGEDGTVQGLLELANIPYVGAGVAASAVGMDKALMKLVFRAHNLPVVDWVVVLRHEWEARPEQVIEQIQSAFGYPCFIKPANLGSSVAITKAHNRTELERGLALAARFDRKLIAERAALGVREIECSVLGNDEPIASLPGEVLPKREFYDYAAKYDQSAGTELVVPADLPPETVAQVRDLAVRAFQAIDCCGMARVDFFVERAGSRVWLNEINTIPGFTAVSMYPRMWEKSGVSYRALVDRLIQLAVERHADKRRSITSDSSSTA